MWGQSLRELGPFYIKTLALISLTSDRHPEAGQQASLQVGVHPPRRRLRLRQRGREQREDERETGEEGFSEFDRPPV